MAAVTVTAGAEVMLRAMFLCALVRPVAVKVSVLMDGVASSAWGVGIGDAEFS